MHRGNPRTDLLEQQKLQIQSLKMRVCPEAQMLDWNLFLPDTFDADIVVDSNDWLRPAHIVREI